MFSDELTGSTQFGDYRESSAGTLLSAVLVPGSTFTYIQTAISTDLATENSTPGSGVIDTLSDAENGLTLGT